MDTLKPEKLGAILASAKTTKKIESLVKGVFATLTDGTGPQEASR